MKTGQYKWVGAEWRKFSSDVTAPQLCLLFGSRMLIEHDGAIAVRGLKSLYPQSTVITVSTAGNIIDDHLVDNGMLATCIQLEKTAIRTQKFSFGEGTDEELGTRVAEFFEANDLAYLMIFSSTGINAGSVLKGINTAYKGMVPVSGGVAGDDTRFEKTLVGINEDICAGQLVAVGFYGTELIVSHGSKGGWTGFGPIRKVTKADQNRIYEVDGKPILDLYKYYLGEKAKALPASGLLFPLAIIEDETSEPIVRGIQNIDEDANALILYGDISEGQNVQLMRADFDELIRGAGKSAGETFLKNKEAPELALLISCVARRMVLGQMTEEELLEVKNVLGLNTTICGFYSYSELSPVVGDRACHLHNQTMTVTTLSEKK